MAIDANGNLYIADYLNDRVIKLDANNRVLWTYNTSHPNAVALDSLGNVYIVGSWP